MSLQEPVMFQRVEDFSSRRADGSIFEKEVLRFAASAFAPHASLEQARHELLPARKTAAHHLDNLFSWSQFDVFALEASSFGHPLQLIGLALLQTRGIAHRLRLPLSKLHSFFADVEAEYCDQPYHNNIHAADVTQALGTMMALDGWSHQLTDIEQLALIIACAVHDLGHPGVSNDFHLKTNSLQAQNIDASSVNESIHASLALQLLQKPANNFLSALPAHDAQHFLHLVSEIVLSTDMACHLDILASFTDILSRKSAALSMWTSEERLVALQMLVHCADISNPARPLEYCKDWSDRVHREFFAQGDLEKALGMEPGPVFDREKSCPAINQSTFIERKMLPCFEALAGLAPNFVADVSSHVDVSLKYWKECLPSDKTLERCSSPGILP